MLVDERRHQISVLVDDFLADLRPRQTQLIDVVDNLMDAAARLAKPGAGACHSSVGSLGCRQSPSFVIGYHPTAGVGGPS